MIFQRHFKSEEKLSSDKFLYADFNASAPLCKSVIEFLKERLNSPDFANPNAGHLLGRNIYKNIERVRGLICEVLNCDRNQIIFNSGSSEGIANVYFSIFMDEVHPIKKKILISSIEHSATIVNTEYYGKRFNQELVYIPCKENGEIDLEFLKNEVEGNDDITLVTVMAANNETGVIQPYEEISKICRTKNIPFVSDTTQLIGKAPFDFKNSGIDYAMASGHKFGSMVGSGFMMTREPNKITSMIKGGGQEKGIRCGTQNYLAIESMEPTLSHFQDIFARIDEVSAARDNFEKKLKENFDGIMIFGESARRVSTTSYLAKKGTIGQDVRDKLEKEGIYITTSSACSDQSDNVSKVLKAMGIPGEYAAGALRISLCLNCEPAEYDRLYDAVAKALS